MIIGIDPGTTGAAFAYDPAIGRYSHIRFSKANPAAIDRWLRLMPEGSKAVLEQVGPSPQMSKQTIFTFGQVYGGIQWLLQANNLPYELVAPVVWQKPFKTGSRKLLGGYSAKKKQLGQFAKALAKSEDALPADFPWTADLYDAYLICYYAHSYLYSEQLRFD